MSTISAPSPSSSPAPPPSKTDASATTTTSNAATIAPPSTGAGGGSSSTTKMSSAARRNALREFYKLSSQAKPAAAPAMGSSESGDADEDAPVGDGDDELDRLLHSATDPAAAVDQYVTTLVQQHDLKTLLRRENALAGEVRLLDSEGKALVYNNYSKLTAASTTLGRLQNEVGRRKGDSAGELEAALKVVAEAAAAKPKQETQKQKQEQGDRPSEELARAARWVETSAVSTITALIVAGDNGAAKACADKSSALLEKWIATGHLDTPRLESLQKQIAQCTESI